MKIGTTILLRLLYSLIPIVFSALLFWLINYDIYEYYIVEDYLIVTRSFKPILYHSLFAGLAIIALHYYFNKTVNRLIKVITIIRNDLYSEFLLPLKRSINSNNLLSVFRFRINVQHLLLVFLVLFIALIQTYTIWDYWGEWVDENNLFHYAIGFFGGNFNPNWDGYGNLGMYILYFIYLILSIPPLIVGKFNSIDDYAMQMFYNGYFVIVARYTFAIFGVISVFIFATIANNLKISKTLIFIFLIISIFSFDGIFYANFLKTDQLVGFFVAIIIFSVYKSDKKPYLYLLAIAVAGAISSKISALPLIFVLLIYLLYRYYDNTIKWPHVFGVGFVFVFFIFAFQPYVDIIERSLSIIKMGLTARGGGEGSAFRMGVTYHYTIQDRLQEIYYIFEKSCSKYILYTLPLLVFSRKYSNIVMPSLLVLSLLILPYITSNEITHYWFLPVFNLVRFLSLIAIAGFIETMVSLIRKYKFAGRNESFYLRILIFAFFLFMSYNLIWPNLISYLENFQWKKGNRMIAEKWIEENLLDREYILLERHFEYEVPRVYDKNNITESKNISKAFKYNRNSNTYLNRLFEEYLKNHYCKLLNIDTIVGVRQIEELDVYDPASIEHIQGKYYVTTSRNNYLFDRSADYLSPERRDHLENLISYYRYMTSNPLHKSFDDGRGWPVEIYHITLSYDDYHGNK